MRERGFDGFDERHVWCEYFGDLQMPFEVMKVSISVVGSCVVDRVTFGHDGRVGRVGYEYGWYFTS